MVVYGGGELIVGCGWLWVVATKLWVVVGGWQQNYGWSWMVAQLNSGH